MIARLMICTALAGIALSGQVMQCILYLEGADNEEELSQETLERYERHLTRKLPINLSTLSGMVSSGLLSRYQASVVCDYRSRNGDILSTAELSQLDGFPTGTAEALEPFVSFETTAAAGRSSTDSGTSTDFCAKSTDLHSLSTKYCLESGNRCYLGISAAGGLNGKGKVFAKPGSFCMGLSGKRQRTKLLLGNFHARAGQGLCMWSGFSLSGMPSASALVRSAPLLKESTGFSASGRRTGIGVMHNAGRSETAAALLADDGGSIFLSEVLNGRKASGGLNLFASTESGAFASGDFRWHTGRCDLFGETALNLGTFASATIAGVVWSPAYGRRIALCARYYSPTYANPCAGAVGTGSKVTDQTGIGAAFQAGGLSGTLDAVHFTQKTATHQFKGNLAWSKSFSRVLTIAPRLSMRYQPCAVKEAFRAELRTDAVCTTGKWSLSARLDALYCNHLGLLFKAGALWKADRCSASLDCCSYRIPSWSERIYVYQRDIPGSFNVPARYGTGWDLSACASCRFRSRKDTTRSSLHTRLAMESFIHPSGGARRLSAHLEYRLSTFGRSRRSLDRK